jgi:formylglycine-generating enzyme required for sulfatase activity
MLTAPAGQAVTVPASEDTTGYKNGITTGASNASSLVVDALRNAYIYFNLDGIPEDAVVRFARLRIYLPGVRQQGSGFTLHRVLGQWNEALAGPEPASVEAPVVTLQGRELGSRRFITMDVTDLTQEWINGTSENEGVVIRAIRSASPKVPSTSFTIAAKEGPLMGMPAQLEIEFWDDGKPGESQATVIAPVSANSIGFSQLSQDLRELLTPSFKPNMVVESGSAGKKYQLEAVGVFGAKGAKFEWLRNGGVVDLGSASVADGQVVRLDTSTIGDGTYVLVASNGPATAMSEPIVVSKGSNNLARGLVLHLPFNGNARDSSGRGNHGTVLGAKLTTDRFGNVDSAYVFDGKSMIKVEHKEELNTLPMTVSCWFQTTDKYPGHMVEKYENATWNGWGLSVEDVDADQKAGASGFFLKTRSDSMIGGYDGNPTFGGGGPLNDGQWHHATLVVDKDSGRIFVDGKLVDTQAWQGVAGSPTADWPLYIGHRPQNVYAMSPDVDPDFKGAIDDVRLYNRAFDSTEVADLYTAEKALPQRFAMVEIPQQKDVLLGFPTYSPEVPVSLPPYRIGADETTFAIWSEVVKAAKQTLGWTLAEGTKGSGGANLTSSHPVTNVTFEEVAVWCNAASKLDGLDAVYFTMAEGKKVLLTPETQKHVNEQGIHWEKAANGYRLPTGDEWEVAARGGLKSRTYPWGEDSPSVKNTNWVVAAGYPQATTPVGTYPRNGFGLSDCAGNAFEMTWDTSAVPGSIEPELLKGNAVVRGGAWNQGYLPKISGNGWDLPITWDRRTEYGFRVAQNTLGKKGVKKISLVEIPLQKDVLLGFPSVSPEVSVSVPAYRIGADETTFALWSEVVKAAKQTLGWTLAEGTKGSGGTDLTSSHPVTNVTFEEVAVWCNAASKLDGFDAVYFTMAEGKKVPLTPETQKHVSGQGIHWEKAANGYRLPTGDEWEVAARGGLKSRTYPWGEDSPSVKNTNWVVAAGYPQATTPVGTYARNGFGLSDCAGNAFEMTWDTSLAPGSPVPDLITATALVRGGAWNQGYLPKISGYGWDLPITWDRRTEYGFRIAQNADPSK